jgi:membrane protease YdiL (CAAX protease family)
MHEAGPDVSAKPAVPWSAAEIFLVFLVGLLCQTAVYTLLDAAGFYRWYYGGDGLKEAIKAGGEAGRLAQYRLGLWAGAIGTLLQVIAAPGLLRLGSGTTPEEVGLTTRNLGRNAAAGLAFAVIFVPGAYGLQALALGLVRTLGGEEQAHPFTLLAREGLHPAEWVLLVGAAVALAPLWEELFYRGIVQPWVMSRQPWGGPVALAVAFAVTASARADHVRDALAGGGRKLLLESLPFVTLLALAGVYAALSRPRRFQEAGLFATAVLFAWVHAGVWPSPVALLWLALGLGWLRWRGRSLAGCVVLHAAFNAVACLVLLLSPWWGP